MRNGTGKCSAHFVVELELSGTGNSAVDLEKDAWHCIRTEGCSCRGTRE